MFNTKCAVAGCHDVGSHKPYLTPDVSYYELVNGGYVNTAVPDQDLDQVFWAVLPQGYHC